MTQVGFVGTGEIASAMVAGLAGRGHRIIVSERGAAPAAALAARFEDVEIAPNQTVLDESDFVIICLLEEVADAALSSLTFRDDHQIVSAMLGVGLSRLRRLCAPAKDVAVTIPLPFIRAGGCPLPVYPRSDALTALYGADNPVISLSSEAALNPHFAATALCSTVFDQLRVGAEWLAGQTGDAKGAEAYVTSLMAGFLAGTPKDGAGRIAAALASLDTPGGLNRTLREHMRAAGTADALADGLDGFRERLGLAVKED